MKALKKAFNILDLFLGNRQEMSLAELTELSGFNKTTVYRIVSTLLMYGYLKQREKRGKYSLGMKFLDFSGLIKSRMEVRNVAIPYIIKLGELVNESVIMAIWDGRRAIITETFNVNYPLRVVPDEGARIPLYSTALGKIILANMTEKELEKYFNSISLERYTSNTITDLSDIKKYITIIKQEGVAFDYDEDTIGVSSVAAELRNSDGDIMGSIGVIGPSVRLTRTKIRKITPNLKSCALEISRELGYRRE